MMLLPQLSRILKFFIKKNLRIARGRAYNLTVTSRGKPAEFWSEVSVVSLGTRRCEINIGLWGCGMGRSTQLTSQLLLRL